LTKRYIRESGIRFIVIYISENREPRGQTGKGIERERNISKS